MVYWKDLEPPWIRLEASQKHLETPLKASVFSNLCQSSFLKDVCSETTIWGELDPRLPAATPFVSSPCPHFVRGPTPW